MPTYITLLRWTAQGLGNLKDSPNRLDAARQVFREMGAEIKSVHLLMGQYDLVLITDAPDDETMARAILATSSKGAVHTETHRAFTEDEYRKIIAALP